MEVIADSNDRIDKYLSSVTTYSRSEIVHMIDNGLVLVNGKPVSKSFKVTPGLKIYLDENIKKTTKLEEEAIDLDIVYEDDDIIVVNKPSGMVVHPGSGNKNHTLVNALLAHTSSLSNEEDNERPGIVHRIDKDTSGLLLVAKTNKAHKVLTEDFKNKRIKREYIALIVGVYPHNKAKIIAPIGRGSDRKKFEVTDKNSKDAVTNLEVIKRYNGYTLVKLKLETGRTHQIRVHMKYIGYPIYNDPVYYKSNSDFNQFLHAKTLEFNHPITKEKMSFTSDLPKEFKDFLDTLE